MVLEVVGAVVLVRMVQQVKVAVKGGVVADVFIAGW